MVFCQINLKKKITIILVMQHLKMEVVDRRRGGFGGFSGADFSDIFEDFFGDFGGGKEVLEKKFE